MAINERISAPKKLNLWGKVKKMAGGVYDVATDIGEEILPYTFQNKDERSLKRQSIERYPMTSEFKKRLQDMPTNLNTSSWKQPIGSPASLAGGLYKNPSMNMIESAGDKVFSKLDEASSKVKNPVVKKVSDYLVDKFYKKLDENYVKKPGKVNIISENPKVMTHEVLHGWYKDKVGKENLEVPDEVFSSRFNKTWNSLKEDKFVGDYLKRIDDNIMSHSELYSGIEKDPFTLANERYAYLGSDENINRIMSDYPEIKELYRDVFVPTATLPKRSLVMSKIDKILKKK